MRSIFSYPELEENAALGLAIARRIGVCEKHERAIGR